MSSVDRERQMAQAEEVLGDRLHGLGFAKGLFFGQYLGPKLPPYPDLFADPRTNRAVTDLEAFCRQEIDAVAIDRNAEIPDSVVRGLGWLGVLGRLPAEGVRRRRLQPNVVLPDDRSAGRTLQQHGPVRQCASFDRPAGARPVRHARSASPLDAQAGQRRMSQRLCPDRARGRQRRGQRPDHGHAHARRQRLFAQRRKALDHQRRHRPRADRDGPHASGRQHRNQDHGVPGDAGHAGLRSGGEADAQVRSARHGDVAAGVSRHVGAARECAGAIGQGAQSGPHGARFRPHDVRRQLHGSGQVLRARAPSNTP